MWRRPAKSSAGIEHAALECIAVRVFAETGTRVAQKCTKLDFPHAPVQQDFRGIWGVFMKYPG
jgi:hypothetical protein